MNNMAECETSMIIFGDEIGAPMVIEAALNMGIAEGRVVIVIDPRRIATQILEKNLPKHCLLLKHPEPAYRPVFLEMVRELRPTLGVVCSFSRILWPELLGVFVNGIVNVHNGCLPEQRGTNIIQWAIINGDKEICATLHYVVEEVDAGPVIDMITVPIAPSDTALTLRDKLIAKDKVLLNRWLQKLFVGRVPARPQDASRAHTLPRRCFEDGRFDWSWSDERISALTRALVHPWPGAYYEDETGSRILINKALSPMEVAKMRKGRRR